MTGRAAAGAAAALAVALAGTPPASAEGDKSVWIDEVEAFGDAEAAALREGLGEALVAEGLKATFSPPNAPSCRTGDRRCLAARARERGADLAVRITYLALAEQTSVAVEVVSARDGRLARHVIRRGELDGSASDVAAWTLTIGQEFAGPRRGRPTAAWAFAGTSAGLAAIGGAAISWALWRRHRFLTDHVDAEGHVVGLSPAAAHSAQTRARLWSVTGALALTGAVASGVTAGVLFSRSGSEGRSTIAVQGRF